MFIVTKKPKTPNILWDGENNRPLCKFVKGVLETSDEKLAFKGMSALFNHPLFWSLGKKLAWIGQKLHPLIEGSAIDPAQCWTATRKAPKLVWHSFKDLWKKYKS